MADNFLDFFFEIERNNTKRSGIIKTAERESRKRIANLLPESRLGISQATIAERNPTQTISSNFRADKSFSTNESIAFVVKHAAKINKTIVAE
jgi:hypothetical protein